MIDLESSLDSFDIPESRRDVSKAENVRWLLRNLPINNQHNPKLARTMLLLSNLNQRG